MKCGTAIGPALGPDAPAMAFDDAPHYCKAHAGAFEFMRGVQALEHPEQSTCVTRVEAGAVVPYGEYNLVVSHLAENADLRLLVLRAVFQGVGDRILPNLAQHDDIPAHGRKRADVNRHIRAGLRLTHELTQQGCEIDQVVVQRAMRVDTARDT